MAHYLTTERLLLRRWRETDRIPFREMNADPRVMEFMPELLASDASDALIGRLEDHFNHYGFGLFAVDLRHEPDPAQRFVGFIGLSVPSFEAAFMPTVEIGWRLAAEHWGEGLATEAAHAVVQHAFETIGLRDLVSFTVPQNLRSRRVMEKLGMSHDPAEDFDHPRLPEDHPLRRHVLYRLSREQWEHKFVSALRCPVQPEPAQRYTSHPRPSLRAAP
jgi:RimJ/RimL family protein N-acetyltransferase